MRNLISLSKDQSVNFSNDTQAIDEIKSRIVNSLDHLNIRFTDIGLYTNRLHTGFEIFLASNYYFKKIIKEISNFRELTELENIDIIKLQAKNVVRIEMLKTKLESYRFKEFLYAYNSSEHDVNIPIILGVDIHNTPYVIDLSKTSNIQIRCINSVHANNIIDCMVALLCKQRSNKLTKLIFIDSGNNGYERYKKLPDKYLASFGNEKAISKGIDQGLINLNNISEEIEARYDLLKSSHVRSIDKYNELNNNERPQTVVFINDFVEFSNIAGYEFKSILARISIFGKMLGIRVIILTSNVEIPQNNVLIDLNFILQMVFNNEFLKISKGVINENFKIDLIGSGDYLLIDTEKELKRRKAERDIKRFQFPIITEKEFNKFISDN